MGTTSRDNQQRVIVTLRSRDLPFAYVILLCLAVFTLCSMAWFCLSNKQIVRPRLAVPQKAPAQFKVDINRATWPEIANLPKVGPSLAKAIVDHRITHGLFKSAEDLTNVDGIGPKKLAAIEPLLLPLQLSDD